MMKLFVLYVKDYIGFRHNGLSMFNPENKYGFIIRLCEKK